MNNITKHYKNSAEPIPWTVEEDREFDRLLTAGHDFHYIQTVMSPKRTIGAYIARNKRRVLIRNAMVGSTIYS